MDFVDEDSGGESSRPDLGRNGSGDNMMAAEQAHRENADGLIKLLGSTEVSTCRQVVVSDVKLTPSAR